MEIKKGLFACGNKIIDIIHSDEKGKIEYWQSRKSDGTKEWIFCGKYARFWRCFSIIKGGTSCKGCREYTLLIIYLFMFLHVLFISLLIISFIIDLIRYICCGKYYEITINCEDNGIKLKKIIKKKQLWKKIKGFTEQQWNCSFYKLKCPCGYESPNFNDFINSNPIYSHHESTVNTNEEDKNLILINFCYNNKNQNIYSDFFKINDNFNIIINKLYEKNPTINNEKVYFTLNGLKIDENKSLLENQIKSGDTIMIEEKIKINFISTSQRINYSILCKKDDNFQERENKLGDKFSVLKNNNKFFIANGMMLNPNDSLLNNHIKNDDTILIKFLD